MGGLGSILGTIGKSALSSLKADPLGTLGDLGGIMGHAAQGSANQRTAENRSALDYGLLQQRGANDQFGNDLKSADYAREGQDRARRSAILSALLSGVTDASIVPGNPRIAAKMPTMTGGLRPSALAGSKDSLLALIGGQTDPMAPKYQAPALPQLQQAGGFEKTLGGLGLGSSILGALGRKQQPPPIMS